MLASLAKAEQLGGTVVFPAAEIPGMGIKTGLFTDPEGNLCGVMQRLGEGAGG